MIIEDSNLRLAQACVVNQKYRDLFTIEEAFKIGTIFKELYHPYKMSYKSRGKKYE